MPTPIRGVLFDYGQVLTLPPDPTAWAEMKRILTLEKPEDEPTFHAAYWHPRTPYDRGDLTGTAYWHAVAAHASLTLTPAQVAALIAADTALWTRPNQPMVAFAARLQAAGTPTGILSNLGDEMHLGVLATLPWMTAFNHSTYSHLLNIVKPHPAIYAHAAAGLTLPPASILFIDDKEENIAGAEAAGLQAIHYPTHDHFLAELTRRNLTQLWQTGTPSA